MQTIVRSRGGYYNVGEVSAMELAVLYGGIINDNPLDYYQERVLEHVRTLIEEELDV